MTVRKHLDDLIARRLDRHEPPTSSLDPPRPLPSYLWPQRDVPLGDEDMVIAPSTSELRVIARLLDAERLAGFTRVIQRDGSPWVEVDVVVPALELASDGNAATRPTGIYRYAIWRYTGAAYRLDEHGAVENDPIPL
jgi:hypothetical protein